MEERQERHSHAHRTYRRSVFWPLLLIIVGILWLLSTVHAINNDAWDLILRLWPLLFVLAGIDSIFRRNHYVGAVVEIGVGLALVLNNLGYFNLSWTTLISLWPVLLIAFGLDILVGRRSALGAVMGVLLGILLVVAVVWLVVSAPWVGQVNRIETLNQALNGAQNASVTLDNVVGSIQIQSGAEPANLVEANLRHFANETITPSNYAIQDGHGVYEIKTQGNYMYPAPAVTTASPDWNVRLTSMVPLQIDSKLVAGDQHIDLSGLKVDSLNAETVVGRIEATVPQEGLKQGSINLVVGEVVIYVPRNTPIHITANTVLAPVTFPEGFERNGKDITSTSASGQGIQLDVSDVVGVVSIQYK